MPRTRGSRPETRVGLALALALTLTLALSLTLPLTLTLLLASAGAWVGGAGRADVTARRSRRCVVA